MDVSAQAVVWYVEEAHTAVQLAHETPPIEYWLAGHGLHSLFVELVHCEVSKRPRAQGAVQFALWVLPRQY